MKGLNIFNQRMAERSLASSSSSTKLQNSSARDALYRSNSEKTFSNDEHLPSLPLPPLKQTLEKYLDSVRCLVSNEDFENTRAIVSKFEKGLGRELHEKLLRKAEEQRNWLEKWWEDVAYLSQRTPLLPLCSMIGTVSTQDLWPSVSGNQIDQASLFLYYQLSFWKLLRKEQLKPHISHDTPWSMHQFRRLFGTVRIPGEDIDKLECHFRTESENPSTPSHVIILHCGHIFTFDTINKYGEILTPAEIALQLKRITKWCQENGQGVGIGALTVDDRTTWAQNRKWLLSIHSENRLHMDIIDSSLLVLVLEDKKPVSLSEVAKETFTGDCHNRWPDKSINIVVYANGSFGTICDHSPFDGLVPMAVGHYTYLSLKECGGIWKGSEAVDTDLLPPRNLTFHIDEHIINAITDSTIKYQQMVDDIDATCQVFTHFGKSFLRPHNIHPEIFVQLAMHLAYYTMYGRPASCYMTSTTRQFYHGRTETLRSCYSELMDWVHAMTEDRSLNEKLKLLHIAVEKFKVMVKDCMQNNGCDRHLLGLYMISVEERIPLPEIFMDPSWTKSGGNGNFVLSTSCIGYTPIAGSTVPMKEDGYGVFYNIENEQFTFSISAFKKCPETNAVKFYQHIEKAALAMEHLLTTAKL